MLSKKIVITAKCHELLLNNLQQLGYEVLYIDKATYADVYKEIDNTVGLITTTSVLIDKRLLDKANELKWIGRLGSGMEHIDVDYATSKKIQCISSPEGNCWSVAEHALGLLLSLANKIHSASQEIKIGKWVREANRGIEIYGSTVGIIGYGNTGSSFAKILQPFNVTVLANDKYKFGFAKDYIKEASIEQICKYANIISFHLPLTQEVKYFANQDFFSALQQKPILLNTSRGEVIHTQSLINALQNNKVAAAGLDVLENEKLANYTSEESKQLAWLNNQSNVLITPHIAGYTHQAFYKMAQMLWNKLVDNGLV